LREGLRFEDYRARYARELIGLLRAMGRERDAFVEAFSSVVLYGDDWGWNRLRDVLGIFSSSKNKALLIELADSITASTESDRPTALVAGALLLADVGMYDRAYEKVRRAVSRPGARTPVYGFLEILAGGRDEEWTDEADAFFDRVLSLFSKKYPDARETAGVMLLRARIDRERVVKERKADRENLKGVIEIADRLMARSTDRSYAMQARILKARVLVEDLHDFHGGLKVLEGVKWPSRGDSLVAAELVSRALIGSGEWKRADSFFSKLEAKGDSTFTVLASFEEGMSLFYRGRYDEALKKLSSLARRYPWSKWANDALDLAIIMRKANMEGDSRALDLYRSSLYLDFRGRGKEALDTLDIIATEHRESFIAPYALILESDIYNKLSRSGEEEVSLKRLTETYPGSVLAPVALERLARLKEKYNRNEALNLYSAILDRYPDYPFIERVRRKFVTIRKKLGAM